MPHYLFTFPRLDYSFRLVVIGYGLVLLLWMSLEDTHTEPVVVLGVALSLLVSLRTLLRRLGGQEVSLRQLLLILAFSGGLVGVGTSISTALLMFFKNAWHAHLFLDFPPGIMLAILERAPAWGLAGVLIGIGIGLSWLAAR
ncbi:MAG TPA: hypothetical protein PLQ56_04420 [Aggregatilineales bacterium]|nr:hypothetical protein [Aggregatilineales bacterium]